MLQTGTPQAIEFNWSNAEGVTLFLEYVIVPEWDRDGKIVSVLAVGHDLTERKEAEETLHRLNRDLRALSSCNQTLIRAVDEQTLVDEICRIICDEAGYRLAWVGYAENDVARTVRPVAWAGLESGYVATAKLSWADDAERGGGPAGRAIRSGETSYVQDIATDPRMVPWRESALQRGFRSGIALPLKDESARVFGVLLIYHSEPNAMTPDEIQLMEELASDLAFGIVTLRTRTERKRAEGQIKQAEEFLNSVIDNLPIAVFAKAAQNGQFMLWNRASEALFGFTKEQVIGKTDYDFFPREQADFFWEKDRESFASGATIDIPEESILTKNLGSRLLHTRKVPVYDKERQPFCLLGISQDITDHKRAENIKFARLRLVEYATSHSLDELLQATLDEVEVLTDSLIGFYHFLEANQRTLLLQAWSTRTLREMCTAEGKGLHYDIDEAGVWVDCVHKRKPVIHNDYSALPHRKGMPPGHANVIRELVVPVFRGDRIVAVLGVGNVIVRREE